MTIQRQLPVEELCRKLKPLFGEKIDELYFRYSVANSLDEKNEIFQILTLLYQKNLNKLLDQNILLEPPKQPEITGNYPLAKVSYAGKQLYDFALNENDWPRHVCISGMSGSGKTNFAFNILENFIRKNKPFLVFDWKKSFRPLMDVDPSLMCFTVGNEKVSNFFRTNINIPPKGVSPKEWINVLCDLLTESFQVSFGVHKILLETLDEIFQGWGIYEGKTHYPNWQHVKKMLEMKAREAKSRESTWYESALRIATVLTFGTFGNVINYDGKKAVSVEDLLDKRVILELNSLSNIEKKFFCEYVLTYLYKSKKAQENKTEQTFDYAIVVDEAHNIFLKDKTHFVSESVTDMIYREMREYGISLICLDQHISKLSDTVKGNSACHVAFQQQLPEDIKDIASLMQIWERKDNFSKLPVGSAIVKLSERYTSPFLVEVPFIELRHQTVEDSKIAQRMNCIVQGIEVEKNDSEFLDEITYEREIESGKWGPSKLEKPQEKLIEETSKEKIPEIPKKEVISDLTETQEVLYNFVCTQLENGNDLKDIEALLESGLSENCYDSVDILTVIDKALKRNLSENETPKEIFTQEIVQENFDNEHEKFLAFLQNNLEHRYGTVELYNKIGFSPRKGNKIKNELLDQGLIEIKEEKNANGWKKYIRLSNSNLLNKHQTNIISTKI